MAWSRRPAVAVISGSGRAGQYQVPSTRMAPPLLAWMPSWSVAVVHDRLVAQGPGRAGGTARGARRCRRGRSRASRSCARGRRRRPGLGRRCRRGLRRAGSGPGRWRGSGARAARRAAGRWRRWWLPAPRRVCAAACPCRLRVRGGRPRGRTSRRRGRWRDRPVRLDGPRENSGTGVASRPVQPSKAARSSSVRTETLASSSALTSASSRSRAAVAWPGVIGLVRALSSPAVSRRFFGSAEGSATGHDRRGSSSGPGGRRPGSARSVVAVPGTPSSRRDAPEQLAEQQPGGLGEEQRPVIEGQAQQRGEHGAHRQRAGPPGAVGQRGLDDRGRAAAVDELGGERHGLIVRRRCRARGSPARRRPCSARLPAPVPGPQHGLGRGAVDVAGVAGQRLGLADAGDGQQLAQRGARGQVIADETGPAPAQPSAGARPDQRPGPGRSW